MEKARHRKSRSASGIEGIQQIQKSAPRLSADSRTYIDRSKRDDLFMLELGQDSWRGPIGKPMKKLLAEEISREVEPRRRRPSVIAQLMGLEGLPSPRQVNGTQRRLLDSYQPKSSSRHYDWPTVDKVKNVYENLEAASCHWCSSRWSSSTIFAKPESPLAQPKLWASDEMDRIAVLKPYESKSKSSRGAQATLKPEDGFLPGHQWAHVSRSLSRAQSETMIEEMIVPTRIVVLKPNLGKSQNLSNPSRRRKDSSRSISKDAREIAREITMRMRDSYNEKNDLRSVWGRGYAGDESSYEGSESDSESEPEGFGLSCRKNFGHPSFGRVESDVNRTAKKRFSERWMMMTHNYRDMEVGNSKDRLLGEMLVLPDQETRPGSLNVKTSPGSISLPPCGRGSRSRKTSSYHDGSDEEKVVMHSGTVNYSRSKFVKGNAGRDKENFLSSYSKSRGKKPHPCQDMYADLIDSLTETNFEIQMEANIKDISEQQSSFELSEMAKACKSPVVDVMMISEPTRTTLSPEPFKIVQKQPSSVTGGDESSVRELGDCRSQVPTKQASPSLLCSRPEPSGSSKEANHPSPSSILEAHFTEEALSAESFERVSAELEELRLQLQLLKMESSTEADKATLFPIKEEDVQLSNVVVCEGNYAKGPEGWGIHYILDVLITSRLPQEPDFSMFKTSWYSPNCPLDPQLFDCLEKKYSDDDWEMGVKWERKLLFDWINSAIKQIFAEHVDLCPWVRAKSMGSNLVKWVGQGVVGKLIDRLGLSEIESPEKVADREMGWAGPTGEVETVGNEIERWLMDDMVAEVFLCEANKMFCC